MTDVVSEPIHFTSMSEFLTASPFDAAHDLYPHRLTEEVFYEHLHVLSDDSKNLLRDLHDRMFNLYQANRVVFVTGFAGNGKTTFLHTFRRLHSGPDYRHIYFDFQTRRTADPAGVEGFVASAPDDEASDEIRLLMNRFLRGLPGIDDTFRFMHENRGALKDDDFISFRLYQYLSTRGSDADDDPATYVREWMDHFDFKDIFTSLFVHLFRESRQGQRTIVYFDNLDIPRMEYIADKFLVYFEDAIACASFVSRHELFAGARIDFSGDYRFIFCLRDANEAILNAHIGDRTGFTRSHFPLAFDAKSFTDITTRRIEYLEKHLPSDDETPHRGGKWSALFKSTLNDKYFENVFLPLYNYNYRELSGAIVEVIRRHQLSERDGVNRWQMRGMVMFGLIRLLIEKDFLAAYRRTAKDLKDGYCYIDRVLLTVLINSSNYRRRVGHGESDGSDPYGLLFIVRDLQGLYDLRVILGSIARCFLSHQSSRIHLLTVLNTKITDPEDFVRWYARWVEDADKHDDFLDTIKTRNDARSVLLKVTPAGFTCVRYILPHFEFYSNLARNTEALFHNPLEMANAEGTRYVFEEKIDKVLELVREHVSSMKIFFDHRYTTLRNMNAKTFPTTKYCFRHQGLARVAQRRGQSHTIKILSAHRDYIERFRQDLLKRPDLDLPTKVRLNESLITRLEKYVALLGQALDQETASLFAEPLQERINTIKASSYTDIKTRIDVPQIDGKQITDDAAE
jgi:hypothetical protein